LAVRPERWAARKAELRAQARRIRAGDRTAATESATRRLIELPELAGARTIALYSAIGDEVRLEAFAAWCRARGARTVQPVQAGVALEMVLDGGDERVAVSEIDAFVVPGLLFDRACRRLGRGGGHYDRLLAGARADASLIGICYAERVVDELPEEPWDVAMDVVVTDAFVLRGAGRRSG
jgi:5-formyltetrahydrofolate cyclo-ligase